MTEAIRGPGSIFTPAEASTQQNTQEMREEASDKVLPVATVESENYAQISQDKIDNALRVIDQLQSALKRGTVSPRLLDDARAALAYLDGARNAIDSQRLALRNQGPHASDRMSPLLQTAKGQRDAIHEAITQLADRANISERILRNHANEWRELNFTSKQLLELEQLMSKYANREALDLDKPENAAETADFARMKGLLSVARSNGVLWDQNGWEKPDDFLRFKRGVGAALSALQSDKMMKQIDVQSAQQAVLRNWLTVTTMLKAHAEMLREIARNMRS